MRWSVGRGLAVWVACSLAGVAVIAFPDDGRRLASFSDGHGPSAVDAAGIVVLIIGWLPFVVALWTARSAIEHRGALIAFAAIGALLVIWSVATDSGAWWVLGIVLLSCVQIAAGLTAMRRHPSTAPRAGSSTDG
jgi:hypothetical protein